ADNGSDGIVVAGTTGESPNLTKEEKLELFRVVKEEVGAKVKVIAGTGSNSTQESIVLSKKAEAIGVDGIMLVVPYYNKPSQEGLYRHFSTIAKEVSVPIMLYNVPGRTVINMLPQTVARLAKIDNVVALKEASGNMDQLSELKQLLTSDFQIYSGDDSLTLPMLSLGCSGVVSVASHLVGNEISDMINQFSSGNHKGALETHLKLMKIFKVLFITANPVPLKFSLNLIGKEVGAVRLPLCEATIEEQTEIKKVLAETGLLSAE
ncbi:MAG: 4-hydroxy-tetrahydrodipicolinate synthase, partial [Bacillota bacterium]|nr:4-hydroxy-tetrahydrodipicolinate synthase [Bacillota bacterium]